jgi:hypothetical protein
LSSDLGVVDNLVHTADTSALSHAELDVTLVTPDGVPGVADDEVALVTLITVANSEDGVVNLGGAAVGLGDDTGLV